MRLAVLFLANNHNINKTINFVGKDPIIGPPKTNNSYRILGMSNTVFNILKMVQQEQNEKKNNF